MLLRVTRQSVMIVRTSEVTVIPLSKSSDEVAEIGGVVKDAERYGGTYVGDVSFLDTAGPARVAES